MHELHAGHLVIADVLWGGLGVLGGVVWELNTWLRTGKEIDWLRLAVHGFVSGFSGYIGGSAMHYFYDDLAEPAAGLCGWFGCTIFKWLARLIERNIGIRLDDD